MKDTGLLAEGRSEAGRWLGRDRTAGYREAGMRGCGPGGRR